MTLRGLPAIVGLLVLLAGCTQQVPLAPVLEAPAGVTPVPIAVGVYLSPELRAFRHVDTREGHAWQFAVGQASVPLLERATALLFRAVEPVAGRPPLEGGPVRIVAVLEASIEDVTLELPYLTTGDYTVEIRYRFTLYSPGGAPVARWVVLGRGVRAGALGFERARWAGEAADLAMQDAATQLVRDFRAVPDVRQWLERIGIRG